MKIKLSMITLITSLSLNLMAQTELIVQANALNNDQLWDQLKTIDLNGNTSFGKCKVQDATQCASCACDYYFTSNIQGVLGKWGWPKNPASGDSTGCMNGCWGGYTTAMCTSDLKANARAMLLHALNNNACGTPLPPQPQSYAVNINEMSKFKFVNPQFNGGEVLCGTNDLAPIIGGVPQFIKISKEECRSAYLLALKTQANGAGSVHYITLAQFNSLQTNTINIQNAIAAAGNLNIPYSIHELNQIQPLIDVVDPISLSADQVALLYSSLGTTNIAKLPQITLDVINPIQTSLSVTQKTTADAKVSTLSSQTVSSKNFTSLDSAVLSPSVETATGTKLDTNLSLDPGV